MSVCKCLPLFAATLCLYSGPEVQNTTAKTENTTALVRRGFVICVLGFVAKFCTSGPLIPLHGRAQIGSTCLEPFVAICINNNYNVQMLPLPLFLHLFGTKSFTTYDASRLNGIGSRVRWLNFILSPCCAIFKRHIHGQNTVCNLACNTPGCIKINCKNKPRQTNGSYTVIFGFSIVRSCG